MSAYNFRRERCAKVIKLEFKEVANIPPSFSLEYVKKFIKRLITVLKYMPHAIIGTNNMADIFLIIPQGAYNGKVPKSE